MPCCYVCGTQHDICCSMKYPFIEKEEYRCLAHCPWGCNILAELDFTALVEWEDKKDKGVPIEQRLF